MRIWSLHPKYLDAKGLVALWREGLLAKHVLEGKTKGYTNHSQLTRFKNSRYPLDGINLYLQFVFKEAKARNYHFDEKKIDWKCKRTKMNVTKGQMEYETSHLLKKLKERSPEDYKKIKAIKILEPHPFFYLVEGKIESWEVV